MMTLVTRLDQWQRRHRPAAFIVAVLRKGGDDGVGALAGLIAYFSFFAIFPLLLVLVTLTGWALSGNPDLRDRILDSALSQIPVIGTDLASNVNPIDGSPLVVVLGLLTALWAGLGVGRGLQRAFDTAWYVPRSERPLLVAARLRALGVVTILGLALVVGSAAAGVVAGIGSASVAGRAAGAVISVALVFAVLLGTFRVLTPTRPWSSLWPGAVVATVGWIVLQVLGAWFVDRVVRRAGDTYGVFAVVIGLLIWLSLLARLLVTAAEVNVVRALRLWPRSLLGPPVSDDDTPADQEAYRRSAGAERRTAGEQVAVTFAPRDGS